MSQLLLFQLISLSISWEKQQKMANMGDWLKLLAPGFPGPMLAVARITRVKQQMEALSPLHALCLTLFLILSNK